MELHAPSHWRTLEFHSDVHLYEQDPATAAAWLRYMHGVQADAVFILGDLFEVWVGDDGLNPADAWGQRLMAALRACAARCALFYLPGNRDFLVGDRFLTQAGMQRLPDPTVLCTGAQRVVLSHGDALCTDDAPYQQFRREVRAPAWQRAFLAQPLADRQAQARGIRQASEQRKQDTRSYVDVNAAAVDALLDACHADTLIHGHTHLPGAHPLAGKRQRLVLSDWCADAQPARLEVLRCGLDDGGHCHFQRVTVAP